MSHIISDIQTKQREWAAGNSIKLSDIGQGYVIDLDKNLFKPIKNGSRDNAETYEQFKHASGNEVTAKDSPRDYMKALYSSSALAVNVFFYWKITYGIHKIAQACRESNVGENMSLKMTFEKMYHTHIDSTPNVDIVMTNNDEKCRTLAIESKYVEPYRSHHDGLKNEYVTGLGLEGWKKLDMPELKKIALSISPKDKEFKQLHAAQLIKHMLGLMNEYHGDKNAFELLYLWYDVPGQPQSDAHEKEIGRFSRAASKDGLHFKSLTYQKLISKLRSHHYQGNEAYFDYLENRYQLK